MGVRSTIWVGAVASACVLAGCGGGAGSTTPPQASSPVTTSAAITEASDEPNTVATVDDATDTTTAANPTDPPRSAADTAVLEAAKETLAFARRADAETSNALNSSGEPKWSSNIVSLRVEAGELIVRTNIFPDKDATDGRYGERICNAFHAGLFDVADPTPRVRVIDSQGGVLGNCG